MVFKRRGPETQITERAFVEVVAMRRGVREPCEECVERCRRVHGRRPSALRVTWFFKIMLSDDIHSVMFIPPRFAWRIMSLAGQSVQLEDVNGNCWTVKISLVGGQLTFKRGWRKFFVDHYIEIGDLLMFHYHSGSQFMVKIFDKSACERLNFSDRSVVDERAMLDVGEVHIPSSVLDLTPIEDPLPMIEEGSCLADNSHSDHSRDAEVVVMTNNEALDSDNNKSRPHVVSSQRCAEVPFDMIDGNEVHEERTRSSCLDLSNMEMAGCNNAVEGAEVLRNEQSSHSNVGLIDSNAAHNEKIRKRKKCEGASLDVTVVKVPRRKCTSEDAEEAESKAICEIVTASPVSQIESNLDHGKAVTENPGISYEAARGASPDVPRLEVPSIKCSYEDADKVQPKTTGVHGTTSLLALTESILNHGKAITQNTGIFNEATRGASPDVPELEVPGIKCSNEDANKVLPKTTGVHGTASSKALTESTLDHGKVAMQILGLSNEATKGVSPDVSLVVAVPRRECTSKDANEVQSKTTCEHGTASPLAQIESTIDHEKATMQNLGLSNEATKGVSPDVSLVVEAPGRKCTCEDANEVHSKTTYEHGTASPLNQIESTIDHEKAVMQNLGVSDEATCREVTSNVSTGKVFRRKCSYLDTYKVQLKITSEDVAASSCAPIDSTQDHEKAALQDLEISNEATRAASPDVSVLKASKGNFTSGVASRLRSKTLGRGKSAMRNLGISNVARRRPSPDVSVVKMPTRKCTSKPSKTCEHGVAPPLSQLESTPDHGKAAMQNLDKSNEAPIWFSLTKERDLTDSGTVFTDAVPWTKHDVHGTSSGSSRQSSTKLLPEKLDFVFKGEKLVAPKLERVEIDYPPVEIERKMTNDVRAAAIELGDFYCSVTVATRSYLVLPKMVLPISCRGRAESRFLLLRDPASRVWPVIYQEKRGFKVFTTGWKSLAKANNIQPGDKCVISAENDSEVFKVQIARRKKE
ncbi:hypothetical protein Sjap_023397 [Stephania japonica]|uniref:TF-B3 domain-containing protein n=1 Tax=Stephania japonica TaxID=461633 RepID=A0AAP0EBI7_9MAGN